MIDDTAPAPAPAGYVSAAAQKRHLWGVILTGVALILLQFVVPMVMMAVMFIGMFKDGMRRPHFEGAAFHEGRIWFVEKKLSSRADEKSLLVSVALDGSDKRVHAGTIPDDSFVWLGAGGERLWIVAGKELSNYRADTHTLDCFGYQLERVVGGLLLDGVPVVQDRHSEGSVLWRYADRKWDQIARWPITSEIEELRFIAAAGKLHAFAADGNTIRHFDGLPTDIAKADAWPEVCTFGDRWTALDLGGTPAVFTIASRQQKGTVTGWRRGSNGWEKFVTVESSFMVSEGLVALDRGRVALLTQGMPGVISVTVIEPNGPATVKAGGSGPFPPSFMIFQYVNVGSSVLIPFAFAGAFTLLMRKNRTTQVADAPVGTEYASLWRRAMAHAVDCLFAGGPMIVFQVYAFKSMSDFTAMSDPKFVLGFMALAAGAMGFACAAFFILSWFEGRTGQTPGKWLLGIRVVKVDLSPCGFGWSLLRNILRLVDCFFGYGIGSICAAFTERHQRVGDLAAGTIVIRESNPRSRIQHPGSAAVDSKARVPQAESPTAQR